MSIFESMLTFRLSLLSESARLKTFKNWVFSEKDPCNASKLAEAGFYYIGSKQEPDSVQCFLCNKCLDGWEKDDDPWQEHQKHTKTCMFANIHCSELELTQHQLLDIKLELMKNIAEKYFDELTIKIQDEFNECRKMVKKINK